MKRILLSLHLGVVFLIGASFLSSCSTKSQPKAEAMIEKSSIQFQFSYESYMRGDLIPALGYALKAEAITPHNPDIKNLLGLIYFRDEKYAQAEAKFKEGIALDPHLAEISNNLGTLYYETKKYALAEKTLEEALLNPLYLHPERIYNNLGLVYQATGDTKKAVESYERAITVKPDFFLVYQNLGKMRYEEKQKKEARGLLQKAADLCKECSEPRYYLGLILKEENKLDEALRVFKQGADIDPKGYYGELCRKEGNPADDE